MESLRHIWIGITESVQASRKFDICIYIKSRHGKYLEENLLAHFEFKMKYHPEQIGIFENKGYLVDKKGFRLAINVF